MYWFRISIIISNIFYVENDLKKSDNLIIISEVQLTDNFVIISPSDIICKCIVREKENGLFLISQFEIDSDYN